MEPTRDGLLEARRQLDSTIHKLKASIQSMEAKPHAARLRSQITLANRRVKAFEIAVSLIERELEK